MNAHVLLGAILFACAAIAGLTAAAAICARVSGFDDGPQPGTPPIVALVAGAALIGGIAGAHTDPARLGLIAVVTAAFVAAWYCDVARGIVPDVFSIGPLILMAVLAFVWHDPRMLVSSAIVVVPFAIFAYLSRGRGMGWGDVKLAAVAGALLGASNALLALALATFAAAVGAKFRRTDAATANAPLAFAPYLIGATALFTAFTAL
ncbi:MAG TPA: prepilin peptidase [Candidatus Elarobacter sp.]|jgi:prepilin signal peptidase PulO-like enzyme (type II secretory pathway)|nr:prepilin peptidase [Candidatus Elarobacter sp.]